MKKYKELLKVAPYIELWDPPFFTEIIQGKDTFTSRSVIFHKYHFFDNELRATPYVFIEDDRKRVMSLSKRKKYIINKLFELKQMGCESLLMVKNSSHHSFVYATNETLQSVYDDFETELFEAMGCVKLGKTIRHDVDDAVSEENAKEPYFSS
ncbi:hypothetical protein CDIK_1267 [Cucumispora dikerogammari]|nr:hypothetical protein CDIK_1267 [Cucumispora dikerogammari]